MNSSNYYITKDMLVIFPHVVAVVGSRKFGTGEYYYREDILNEPGVLETPEYKLMDAIVRKLTAEFDKKLICIISGGATGADSYAERWAIENKYSFCLFPADWDKYGRGAGPKRNKEMADACTMTIAFYNGESSGTENMMNTSKALGKPTKCVMYNKFIGEDNG